MRMMRRAGLISVNKELTLEKLFASATILATNGSNQRTGEWSSLSISTSSASATGICYLFILCNGHIGIYKVVNRAITAQNALRITATSSTGYCGVIENNNAWNYGSWRTAESPYSTSGALVTPQGATLILFQFSIKDSIVDNLFTNMDIVALSSTLGNSPSTVSTTDKTKNVYLACKAENVDFWIPTSSNYTKINNASTSSAAATASNGTLSIGSVYGGSIIGFTNP